MLIGIGLHLQNIRDSSFIKLGVIKATDIQ